jgi:transcriptional regulator with XRE-family HTH domain/tetratricopeptide (TPR) repeat protein
LTVGETLGDLLRGHRLAASLTQEALAERAAMSAKAVAALERGRRLAPRLSTLRQIARALDLSPDQLAVLARAASAPADARPGPGAGVPEEPAGLGADAGGRGERERVPLPAIAARRWRSGLVGRRAELDQLLAAWAERSRCVLVAGEAGIGKTRLVTELARHVFDDGGTVLWGSCSEERLGAYLPFVEVLRHLALRAPLTELRAAMGTHGELVRLLPALEERAGPLPSPTVAEAGTEQRLLFEAMGELLAHWAPLLLVIDDLHWADDATLALLTYLVRSTEPEGVVVVATARDRELDPQHAGRLADLGRRAEVRRLHLDGLRGGDLADLVEALAAGPVSESLAEHVETATAGNPFFAEEMTVHLVDSGLVVEADGGLALGSGPDAQGVPERVRETVTSRLVSLSGPAIELLLSGAVVGHDFDLPTVAEVSGLDDDDLVDAVDEALLSGLLVESGAARVAFSHRIVQHAVAARLSSARRAVLHRRVAESLERRLGAAAAPAAELARHWAAVAATDPNAMATAAKWAVRAGDEALAAAAADEAIARYTEASSLWAESTAGHADVLVRLGTALQHRGRAEEADDRFRQALHLAIGLNEPVLRAQAAIGLGRRYPYWESDLARIDALEAALAGLPAEERLLRLTVMGLLVTQLVNGFHPDEALRRDELAEQLERAASDDATPAEVLLALGRTRIYDCVEDPRRLRQVSSRLVAAGAEASDLRVLAVARFAEGLAALDLGEMPALHAALGSYGEVATRLDDPRERSQAATFGATIAFIEGRYADAEALSDEALRTGREAGDFNAELVFHAQGFLRAVDQGLAAVIVDLLAGASDYQRIPSFAAGTALCAALAGQHERAKEVLVRLAGEGFAAVPRGADRLAPTAFMAQAAVLTGAVELVPPLIAAFGEQHAAAVRVGPLVGWWGPVDHHVGALHGLAGDLPAAERHLRRALAMEEAMGARPFLARTRGALARVLRQLGPDRSAEATAAAEAACATAEEVGAAGVTSEVEAALAA